MKNVQNKIISANTQINKKKLFENIRLIFKNKKNSLDKIQTKQI